MDLDAAREHIQGAFARMNALYQRAVFDEWAILSPGTKTGVLAYAGPRELSFRQHLPKDAEPLRAAVAGRQFDAGEFEFAADAAGTRYDACMKIGPTAFLVFNNTALTMSDIRSNPPWLKAQTVIFELGEKFRADPLEP
ncbi:MAG TPA: hypothetical protein VHE13_03800 [Opitutus sp.]|nr:hypothetical protein [Opitutus sp.]